MNSCLVEPPHIEQSSPIIESSPFIEPTPSPTLLEEPTDILASRDAFKLARKEDRLAAKKKKLEEKIKQRDMKYLIKKQLKQDRRILKKSLKPDFLPHDTSISPSIYSFSSSIAQQMASSIDDAVPSTVTLEAQIADATPMLVISLDSVPTSDRESQLLRRIAELEADNARLDNEKKCRMRFMMSQMDDLNAQLHDRDEKIARIETELEQLHDVLLKTKQQENKLEKLLLRSKDVLIDGIHTLSKNVGDATEKSWAKVQYEAKGLFNVDSSNEKEYNILQKMREFAATLKDEIKDAFHSKPSDIQAQPINADMDEEQLTADEADEQHRAELASLETFAEEQRRNQYA